MKTWCAAYNAISIMLAAMLSICAGCVSQPQESDFAGLIRSSQKARSLGHEDAAANDSKEGRAHLEVLRKSRGVASQAYCEARRLVVQSMLYEDNVALAIKLLENDIPELSDFKDQNLRNGDGESVECALFLAPLLSQLADLQFSIGRYEQAEKNARRSFELARILGGSMDQDSALSQIILVDILRIKGKDSEALQAAKKVMPNFDRWQANREGWMRCLFTIADLEASLGQTKQAKKDFDRLIEATNQSTQPGNSSIALALAAAFYRKKGDEKEYSRLKDKAIRLAAKKDEPRASAEIVYETLGDSSQRFSKFSEALGFYETALNYANKFQLERLAKKISVCKKNKAVISYLIR